MDLKSPIGLVAGNGVFPLEFVENARSQGLEVVVVAHHGETDPAIETLAAACTWVHVGQLKKVIRAFEYSHVEQVAFVGGIKRVGLSSIAKLDGLGLRLIARLKSVRDDSLLRGIAGEFERRGFTVITPSIFLKDSIARRGVLTGRRPTEAELRDALTGWEVAEKLGECDVGQTVVVADGAVVAVEAIEGTDRAIARGGEYGGKRGVVVKLPKPQQDLRLDLPSVGPKTIDSMASAGMTVLVLQSGKTLIADPEEVVRRADRAGIVIIVADTASDLEDLG